MLSSLQTSVRPFTHPLAFPLHILHVSCQVHFAFPSTILPITFYLPLFLLHSQLALFSSIPSPHLSNDPHIHFISSPLEDQHHSPLQSSHYFHLTPTACLPTSQPLCRLPLSPLLTTSLPTINHLSFTLSSFHPYIRPPSCSPILYLT